MREEDVDIFFCHTACQDIAPNHVCIITPERPACCGCTYEMYEEKFRKGEDENLFKFEKGDCLDPIKGEYSGVNEIVKEKSNQTKERYFLHSMFVFPHSACGCFDITAFYIEAIDRIGIVEKGFVGTVIGMTEEKLRGKAAGGAQVEGYIGTCEGYLKSPKFLQADGGWEKVGWISSNLKKKVLSYIPGNFRNRIATEKDARTVNEMKKFLRK